MRTEKKTGINLFAVRSRLRATLLSLFLFACSAIVFGQTQSGISGSISDPTGAAVPNAKVTMTSEDTGVVFTTTSNPQGFYNFPSLAPGYYNVQVSAPGFKRFSDRHLQLELGQLGRLDAALTVGNVSAEVVVNADESPLQTDTVTLQTDISPIVENSLPILVSGAPRAATTFTALMPGVSANGGTSGVESETINGGQSVGQEAILDGISMQEGGESQGGTSHTSLLRDPSAMVLKAASVSQAQKSSDHQRTLVQLARKTLHLVVAGPVILTGRSTRTINLAVPCEERIGRRWRW